MDCVFVRMRIECSAKTQGAMRNISAWLLREAITFKNPRQERRIIMKTKTMIIILIGLFLISFISNLSHAANDRSKGKSEAPGEKAKAPALEKIEFIHYKKDTGKAKPPCNHDGICDPGEKPSCPDCKSGGDPTDPTPTCYAFMGQYGKKYLKWRALPVEYVINPTDGSTNYLEAIEFGALEWNNQVTPVLFDLIDPYSDATYNDQDNVNAVCFQNYYTDPDIIGACMVWYNPATKAIVEFDIVFETNYVWGDATIDSSVMDLQNIATHELGHALGLADIYDEACSEVTMYGYSDNGEIKKRDPEEPDITGAQTLYGP